MIKILECQLMPTIDQLRMQNNEKNILIINYVKNEHLLIPSEKAKSLSVTSISIPFSIFSISASHNEAMFVIRVRSSQYQEVEADKKNGEETIILTDIDDVENSQLSYIEKKDVVEQIQIGDPLNIKALELTASTLGMDRYYKEIINISNGKLSMFPNPDSKYEETINIINELGKMKQKSTTCIYKQRLLTSYEMFEIYFSERFAYGVINLGVYIFSLLANAGELILAQNVFFKTEMYLKRDYASVTKFVAGNYLNILYMKSSSIFEGAVYLEVVKGVSFPNKKDDFVYRINCSAILIAENNYEQANQELNCINYTPTVNDKNESNIKYESILLNNQTICDLNLGRISLENAVQAYQNIANEHLIFALNFNMLAYCTGANDFIDIIAEFEDKLIDSFYDLWYKIHNVILKKQTSINPSDVAVEGIIKKEIKKYQEIFKKIKSLESTTDKQAELEVVKTLLIDFNIWDYSNFNLEC